MQTTMLYRARYLLTMNGPPLEDAAIRIVNGLVTEIGPIDRIPALEGESVWEGPNHVLMPGLINAHAHLELHHLRGRLTPGSGFSKWVQELRKETEKYDESDWTDACRLGALESLRHGTTSLVDIGNSGAICAAVADLPFRVFACLEVLGLNPALANERLAQAKSRWESTPNGTFLKKSLVPHSAYSLSLPLLKALANESREWNSDACYSIHAGESREEMALFAEGSGELQAMCQAIFSEAPQHTSTSALKYLTDHSLLPSRALIVHANGKTIEDAPRLKGLDPLIVHCPQSHAFFSHPRFEAQAWLRAGFLLALGTDSLASGQSLSLWESMRQFSLAFPEIQADAILQMATLNPGRTLSPTSPLGILKKGAIGDLIGIQTSTSIPHIFSDLIHETSEVGLVVVGGEPVLI